ncbi:synaptonemal complex protein 1-like protein [Lates japonicus]|uniref:Synaptonemal complex protein 1-like protein n=1 Tax=Lates japonicus TaxID=270547 RepID=A0AAD3M539_LATJO|nr:synaptonemal complex protein 1-like protein [Lates japonicus]
MAGTIPPLMANRQVTNEEYWMISWLTKNTRKKCSATGKKRPKRSRQDYEELKVAHVINQEKFDAELQAEKEEIRALQNKLKISLDKVTVELQAQREKN